MTKIDVSIILPFYNQSPHIQAIVRSYVTALEQRGVYFELIVVPNGCTDDSVSVCRNLSAADSRIRTVAVERGGWGWAVISGLRVGTGKLLCYTNTARTNAELLTQCLVTAMSGNPRVVKVTRIERRGSRYWGSALYNWLGRTLLGTKGRDMNGTPKVFPADFQALRQLIEPGDLLDLEFMVICDRYGYQVQEIAAPCGGRQGGVSTTTLGSAYRMYLGLVCFWLKRRGVVSTQNDSGGRE